MPITDAAGYWLSFQAHAEGLVKCGWEDSHNFQRGNGIALLQQTEGAFKAAVVHF